MSGHLLVIGETQSGKTFYANRVHQRFQGVSIFWNTNHAPFVWGEKAHSINGLAQIVARSRKINFLPPANAQKAALELERLTTWLFHHGRGATGTWCQVLVDEAQEYSRENSQNDPVRMIATRGLGAYGMRLVAITQYPVTLNTTTRTNCAYRVIFRPGIEGQRFLESYGAYPPEIMAWTERKYHFASYHPGRGWAYHQPVSPPLLSKPLGNPPR